MIHDRTVERIAAYAQSYIARFNEISPALGELGPPVSLLSDPISVAVGFPAEDGIVLFYLSARNAALVPDFNQPGIHILEDQRLPLARLVQALTFNHVKTVPEPRERLRADLGNLPRIEDLPADLPREELLWIGISPEMHEAVRAGHRVLTAMAISPIRRLEDGLVVAVEPTRVHIMSPVLSVMSGELVRQYLWSFADVLWYPERLRLGTELARELADRDVEALRLGMEAGVPQARLFADPFAAVAEHIEEVVRRFEALLGQEDVDEPVVQGFLEDPQHGFLVAPVHREIRPRQRLGGGPYIPDFTVLKADGEYHFVEIESPRREIYQASGEEQAGALTHAETQVADWLRYVEENRDTVRREDGLTTIYAPTGEVVAGRDSQLGPTARRRFEYRRSQPGKIRIRTYDDVIRDARSYAEVLRNMRVA